MATENITIRTQPVPALTPELVRRYASGDPALGSLYAHAPFDAARPPPLPSGDRRLDDELSSRIMELNRATGGSERSLANCDKLRDPATHAVLAGQQPGLLLGPLFVLYKIVTLVARCRDWESRSGKSYVPVFWIASHDADLAEIDHAYLPGSGGEPEKLRYPWVEVPRRQLGAYEITETDWNSFRQELRSRLPETEFRDEALARFQPSRFPAGTTEAFAGAIHALFQDAGIVCFDGRDAETSAPGRSFLAGALREPGRTLQAWREGEERVRAAGLKPPLDLPDSRFPLFLVDQNVRRPITWNDTHFEAGNETFAPEEIAGAVERGSRTVSPNAGLRPLLQDFVFNTSATVAGQSELAYHPQLALLYQEAGIARPVLVPRVSLSIAHFRAQDQLADLGLTLSDLRSPGEAKQQGTADDPHAESRDRFLESMKDAWHHLAEEVGEESNARPIPGADDTQSSFLKAASRSADKLLKQVDRAGDNRSRKIHKLVQDLAPKGGAQEFVWSILPLMARYGPDFPARIGDALRDETPQHQLVVVDPRGTS